MSKFALLAAAFAAGASVALSLKAAPVDTLKSARIRAKARLREALAHDDKVSNPDVIAAVDALSIYNPTAAPAYDLDAFLGNWRMLNAPEFKGDLGLAADGRRQYSLGRMTFGIYEPKDLVCAIDKVLNPVKRRGDVVTYDLEIPLSFKDAAGRTATGTLINTGECESLSESRVGVKFTGGSLCPDGDEECDAAWASTFGAAFANAKPRKRERVVNWLLKRMMGLEKPKGLAADGSMSYEIKKPPKPAKNYLDILYLDDELRITRGSKGSVVIAERARDAVAA